MKTTSQTNDQQAGRLRKARIGLILDEPFFGALVMNLAASFSGAVPTMSTDGKRLLINPEFMAGLNDLEVKGVLAHEVLHCALGHIFRRGERDPRLFNQAADYVINNMLTKHNEEATRAGRPAPFPLPDGALIDPAFDGMSVEEIYTRLAERQAEQQKQEQDGEQDGQGDGAGQGDGQPGDQPGEGEGEGQEREPSSDGEFTDAPGDTAEQAEQEAEWKVAVQNAATVAKGQGKLSAGLARMVGELINPKVPWTQVLRDLITTLVRDDYTWTRPNPRYAATGFVLPSLRTERVGPLVVAIDTSGSITGDDVAEFLAEVQSILDEVRPARVDVVQCDAAVLAVDPFEPGDKIQIEIKGGGGTDFRPVFERVEGMDEVPAAVVYLTDAMGDFPDAPPACPVVWAVKGSGTVPFGERVELN